MGDAASARIPFDDSDETFKRLLRPTAMEEGQGPDVDCDRAMTVTVSLLLPVTRWPLLFDEETEDCASLLFFWC